MISVSETNLDLNRKKRTFPQNIRLLLMIMVIFLIIPGQFVLAQDIEPDNPYYVVKEGDSLWSIAARFGLSVENITNANDITDPSQLTIGSQLTIPGLEGLSGELATKTINFGDSLQGISRRYQIPIDAISRLNHLVSPAELYIGYNLVVPVSDINAGDTERISVQPGKSLIETAAMRNLNPWLLVLENDLEGTWDIMPNEILHHHPEESQITEEAESPNALPDGIQDVLVKPVPFVQGKTSVIKVLTSDEWDLSGSVDSNPLTFFPDDTGYKVSLQGIHAMTEPGVYSMVISGTLPIENTDEQKEFSFTQTVLISLGGYSIDPVLIVPPETIDPAITKPEDAEWFALTDTSTRTKLWDGIFASPAPDIYKECWPSLFGNRRSYNGSPYIYFHSGLDFCGGVGTEIFAPAPGKVIFASPLTVRGNATMIDHGWGIYSGYMHQSEILVEVGEMVETGQVIGLVGGTGRVTGPHLHWEIFAGGIQVDPMDWLQKEYP
jgi:murein DD-endopeptidase MepM/ murein hydrolase activator NlpD